MNESLIYDIPNIRLDKKPRPEQVKLLEFTKESILSNNKFILIDAPVGLGKSYYAVMFMDWFKRSYDINSTFDILTNSKILQEQYTNDFDFMNSLWGKGSYECEKHNTSCESGMAYCKLLNTKCDECPYKIAKYKFDNGTVSLSNFHLYLTYQIYAPGAWKRTSRVLIIDEAHDFENVFCDFITTDLNKHILKRNGFNEYEVQSLLNELYENIELEEFLLFVKDKLIPTGKTVLSRILREFKETEDLSLLETGQSLERNIAKWEMMLTEYNSDPDNWIIESELKTIYTKDSKVKDKYLEIKVQPVWAYPYLDEYVWSKYDYIIFMSGTILDKELFVKMNGLNLDLTTYLSLDSPFPVENRPIYFFQNIGKQTFSTKELVWNKQVPIIDKILKKHKNDKGIIHTANYELQRWTYDKFESLNRILAHDNTNRSQILESHYNSKSPTVLASPSMMVGVDLSEDLSRFQVIVKIPYPNLGSKKVKQRMNTIKEYYGLATVRDIIQSYGRSIRSVTDKADTYVIDGCFSDLLKWNNKYFPKWFLEAINYVNI